MPSRSNHNSSGRSVRSRSRKSSRSPAPKLLKFKRISVENAHSALLKILIEFNIPLVKRTFGKRIVRVCCRSVAQFENIALIIKELVKSHLIEEIGMPLEMAYARQTLVMFIKPVNTKSSKKLHHVFQECSFKYHHLLIDVKYPTVRAEKKLQKKAKMQNTNEKKNEDVSCTCMKIFNLIRAVETNQVLIINICSLITHSVVLIGILMTIKSEVSTI